MDWGKTWKLGNDTGAARVCEFLNSIVRNGVNDQLRHFMDALIGGKDRVLVEELSR